MLRLEKISHAYGRQASLREVSLHVSSGEILCLLGPSGCGKTTLLRIVAGLESEYQGQVMFDGADLRTTPVHRREFGLMFQDFALFPHMSVAGNVGYGLRRRGLRRSLIDKQVGALLEQVGLAGMGERDVSSLSGGQKQRVALARSLAPNPRLLMLDEPLGSLDAQLRDQLALEVRSLIKEQGLSAIYITHDHREAYAVADRIAVMDIARIEQVDTPQALYSRPRSAFVARFLGMRNVFSARHSPFVAQLAREAIPEHERTKSLLIHPAGIHLGTRATSPVLQREAVLHGVVFRGDYYDVSVALDDGVSLSFSAPRVPAGIGGAVTIEIALEAVIPLHC